MATVTIPNIPIWGFHLASLPHHHRDGVAGPLVEIGYRVVAVRVTASWLRIDPNADSRLVDSFAELKRSGLEVILDADGKFLTDPWDALAPRLSQASQSEARETLLSRWIGLAKQIDCRLLTFSVGCGDPQEDVETVLRRIAAPISRLVQQAAENQVTLGIKPEIDSVIETASHFHRLLQWLPDSLANGPHLGWAADIAVMASRGELPIGDRLARESNHLVCVYLSDLTAGAAGDTRFGGGDLAIRRIVKSLEEMSYKGPLIARCEGHGDVGLVLAKEAFELMSGINERHR